MVKMPENTERNKLRFIALHRRLKEERLFVKNERDQVRNLNEKAVSLSKNLFCTEWKNRQQWNNVDRLLTAKAKPSECSATSRFIDSVKFEDSYGYLNYEDSKYGNFISTLKDNPKLVACILNNFDIKRIQTSCRQITGFLLSTLYGNCTLVKDEYLVLDVLKELSYQQIFPCEDLISFICGKRSTENAFACLFSKFSEVLFSSKLYLTAALHGSVMQVIVDCREYLDYEVSKVLSRLSPNTTLKNFGSPGLDSTNKKIKDHVKNLYDKLVVLCKRFLRRLFDKIYCFPNSLRWAIGQLYKGMVSVMKLPSANAKGVIGYMLMSYFICPAIINPEPYGINSDADINEVSRHNFFQVASILRSLALVECGMKDDKLKHILEQFDKGIIISYVTELLVGSENDIFETKDAFSTDVEKTSILITEHDLKTLINCLKLLNTYNIPKLTKEGLGELLDTLPKPPKRWIKEKEPLIKSVTLSANMNSSKLSSSPSPAFGCSTLKNSSEDDELDDLRNDLNTHINEDSVVLVIQLDNQCDIQPGMLAEEKVLGLSNNDAESYDINTSIEDQKRKASLYLVDALRETCVSFDSNLTDPNNPSNNPSSGSNVSTDSELMPIPGNSNEIIKFDELPAVLLNLGTQPNDKSNVPTDTLLNLNSDDDDDEVPPALPVKKRNLLLSTPDTKQKPMPTTNPFDSPKLIDIDSDPFSPNTNCFANDPYVPNTNLSNKNVNNANPFRTYSTSSSLIDTDLTSALQNACLSVDSPMNKSSDNLSAWLPVQTSEPDPWGSMTSDSTLTSDSGFENDFKPSFPTRKVTPPANVRYSIGPAGLASSYDEYQQRIIEENATRLTLSVKSTDYDEKTDATSDKSKRNSNAWLMDKIPVRIANTIKNRMKSEQFSMKKDSFNDRLSQNQINTDLGTDVADMPRSKSISSTGSDVSDDGGVEAILEKYRNMKDTTQDLSRSFETSSSFGVDVANVKQSDVEQDVIFDDEFKFEDAKKKLRSVLSKSDQAIIGRKAVNFDDLLLTFLQVKLAESINLQDRFSVASFNETLRSIRQLPSGSTEKLIEELEKEYQQRSKYICYLTQSKQGLLSTISHLEQNLAKLERDSVICSKFFTTTSVRNYLDHPDKKREIMRFTKTFVETKLADEKCPLLNEFLSKLNQEMLRDQIWKYSNETEEKQLEEAIERVIISKIYRDAFHPNSSADRSNDKIFHEHITYLSKSITLSHPALQIPKMYQKEAPWMSAQTELTMISAYKTAADKLACIHRCCVTIMNLLSMASAKQAPGADDFVPVLVYVVLQANPPNLLSTKQYVNTFYESRLTGEEYYCWMQFCAAIEFIKTLRTPDT